MGAASTHYQTRSQEVREAPEPQGQKTIWTLPQFQKERRQAGALVTWLILIHEP